MGYKVQKSDEVCGSQLLHLDSRKRPLWLNSSLRKNKHTEGSREFATLTHWMAPGYNISQLIGWDFGMVEGVDWCAHGSEVVEMTSEETQVVDHMIGVSSRVDILLLPPPPEKEEKEEEDEEGEEWRERMENKGMEKEKRAKEKKEEEAGREARDRKEGGK